MNQLFKCEELAAKVFPVAYERWLLTCKRLQIECFELETFGILENWSLRRGGRNRRLYCFFMVTCFFYD